MEEEVIESFLGILGIAVGIITSIYTRVRVRLSTDNHVYEIARYIRSKEVPNATQEQIDREYIMYKFDIINRGTVGRTINSILFDFSNTEHRPVPAKWLNIRLPIHLSAKDRVTIKIKIMGSQSKVWEGLIECFILPSVKNDIYVSTNTFKEQRVIWT